MSFPFSRRISPTNTAISWLQFRNQSTATRFIRSTMSSVAKATSGSGSRLKNQPLEGVFAIHKPQGITSAQVLRDIQFAFSPSSFFAPWIESEQSRLAQEIAANRQQRGRRQRQFTKNPQVKVGHGGTLDPLATGVLIVGLGSGTKTLGSFLQGTKSYDTTMLFGAATDSYDSEGAIVLKAPTDHLTEESVREKLETHFRGEISQTPPVYSALKVKGKALYEYARNGEEVPEVQARKVTVLDIKLAEFLPAGTHPYFLPPDRPKVERTEEEEKGKGKNRKDRKKRKREESNGETGGMNKKGSGADGGASQTIQQDVAPVSERTASPVPDGSGQEEAAVTAEASSTHTEPSAETASTQALASTPVAVDTDTTTAPAHLPDLLPAARVQMTVSSGFYVRSLCHDLAALLGSAAHMVRLVRTRQSDFSLDAAFPDDYESSCLVREQNNGCEHDTGDGEECDGETGTEGEESVTSFIPVLPYEDIGAGEGVWAPKVAYLLRRWEELRRVKEKKGELREDVR